MPFVPLKGVQRGSALRAAAKPRPLGLGPVYKNTQAGNPRAGMTYRVVDVNGQRVHVYNNGARIAVGASRAPALKAASSTPTRVPAPKGASVVRSPRPRRSGFMRGGAAGYSG